MLIALPPLLALSALAAIAIYASVFAKPIVFEPGEKPNYKPYSSPGYRSYRLPVRP